MYTSILKTTLLDKEGTLRLDWRQGNENLEHESIEVDTPALSSEETSSMAMVATTFDKSRGLILVASLNLPKDAGSPKRGLYIECKTNAGCAILLDSRSVPELGLLNSDDTIFETTHHVDRKIVFGRPARFCLLLKYPGVEFYLHDICVG